MKTQAITEELEIHAPGAWSAEQIKNLRLHLGLNQSGLAAIVGVNNATVCTWERGRRHPSTTAARLLDLLSEDPELLYLFADRITRTRVGDQ
jgi:putative transcriptional regulator